MLSALMLPPVVGECPKSLKRIIMKKNLTKTERLELVCDRLNNVRDQIADLERLIDQMEEWLLDTGEAEDLLDDLRESEEDYAQEVGRLVEEIEED